MRRSAQASRDRERADGAMMPAAGASCCRPPRLARNLVCAPPPRLDLASRTQLSRLAQPIPEFLLVIASVNYAFLLA